MEFNFFKKLTNYFSDFNEEKLKILRKKYPSHASENERMIHNEIMGDCINALRSEFFIDQIRILSLGCGPNYNLYYVGKDNDIRIGVDLLPPPSQKEFEIIEKDFSARKADYIQCDIENYKPKDKFNIVIVSEVAEHVLNPTLLFRKVYEVLDKDGYAVISFPNMLWFSERWHFFRKGEFKNYIKENSRYGHTNIYTKENFLTLTSLEGLIPFKRWPSFSFIPKTQIIKYRKNYSDLFDYGVIWIMKKEIK